MCSQIVIPITNHHGWRIVSKVDVAKAGVCCAFGVASNTNFEKCWCGKGKVGVATVKHAIRHSPLMSITFTTKNGSKAHSVHSGN